MFRFLSNLNCGGRYSSEFIQSSTYMCPLRSTYNNQKCKIPSCSNYWVICAFIINAQPVHIIRMLYFHSTVFAPLFTYAPPLKLILFRNEVKFSINCSHSSLQCFLTSGYLVTLYFQQVTSVENGLLGKVYSCLSCQEISLRYGT
jgi:hypothetical protein